MTTQLLPLQDPEFWQAPYPVINALRESTRIAHTEDGTKAVLRYADVEALLNGGAFENEGISLLERRGFRRGEPFHRWRELALGARNGSEHRRIRDLVGKAMGARGVEAVGPIVERLGKALLDGLPTGELDIVQDIASVLPLQVIGEYLGIPEADRARVDGMIREGQAQAFGVNVTEETRNRVNAMFTVLLEFIETLIDNSKLNPNNDLLSRLLDTDALGDRLSKEECVVLFLNLFVGATESTATTIAAGMWCLGRDPGLMDEIAADLTLVEPFVEEVLRLYPPNLVLANKVSIQDQVFCGEKFAAGERVVVPLGSPNRDPRVFAEPDKLDIHRPVVRHFTFSFGQHFCLGQALARIQLRTFFKLLLARVARIELLTDAPRWVPFTAVNQMESLPARLHVR